MYLLNILTSVVLMNLLFLQKRLPFLASFIVGRASWEESSVKVDVLSMIHEGQRKVVFTACVANSTLGSKYGKREHNDLPERSILKKRQAKFPRLQQVENAEELHLH